jgi:glutamate/tyrosine decarboxylase-like PLP-dependent enzyme
MATWATLAAYGKSGVRAVVEHCLDLAAHCARRVDAATDLVRLAEVPLHVVSFRWDPGGLDEATLDRVNRQIGAELLADGRVLGGTTRYGGRVAHRPTFSNWRTRPSDVDLYVDIVRELGARALRS